MVSRFTALRLARVAAGYRLFDVAQHLDISEQAVGRMERRDLSVSDEQLDRFARLYEVPKEFLLGQGSLKVNGTPPKRR